jgi:hypothetical protein
MQPQVKLAKCVLNLAELQLRQLTLLLDEQVAVAQV